VRSKEQLLDFVVDGVLAEGDCQPALSDRTTVNEQRVQDTATGHKPHAFFRSLPADRFPALAVLAEHIWAGNRDQRFATSLDTLLGGIETARRRNARQPRR
jgi:Tetracyclin repressor-like, C-terminal domain